MIIDDASDPVVRRLRQLAELTPDERRAVRLRARCRAQLQRAPQEERALGPVLFVGLCVLYLSAVVHDMLRLPGMF